MKISRLIKYLEHIKKTYGDLSIYGYTPCDEIEFTGMCVDVEEQELVLMLDEFKTDFTAIFNVYEYHRENGECIDINIGE